MRLRLSGLTGRGRNNRKLAQAMTASIESLERRQMLSVSAETLVGPKAAPKAAGDTWTYSMTTTFSDSTYTIVETVIGNTTFMGNSVTEVDDSVTSNGNSDTHLDKEYYAFDGSGNWVEYGDVETTTNSDGEVTGATTNTESPPELIIPAELTAGQQTAPSTSTQTSIPGTVTISITEQYELQSETKGSVTVPAGTFSAYDLTSNESALQEGNSSPATLASDL